MKLTRKRDRCCAPLYCTGQGLVLFFLMDHRLNNDLQLLEDMKEGHLRVLLPNVQACEEI